MEMTESNNAFDKRIKIEWIQTSKLSVIWAQSQRPLDEKFAKSIADDFDPDKYGTLSVTMPNGKGIYHIIDGQHRKRAAEIALGEGQAVPCQVFNATDPARAAELFDEINSNRKALKTIDLFKVRVTAGDEDHVAVMKIVKANALSIQESARRSDKSICATAALLAVYRQQGADVLDVTLKVLQATWGMDKNAVVAPLLRGYGQFLAEFVRKVNLQRLHETVARNHTPGRFVGAAKTYREMNGGSLHAAVRDLLLVTYNKGLKMSAHLRAKSTQEDEEA
jgi:hypothetical protein